MRLIEVDTNAVNEIHSWLKKHDIKNYNIVNGVVNVNADIHIFSDPMTQIPVQFGVVKGLFQIFDCDNLVDLTNGPSEVHGDYVVSGTSGLKSLTGIAKIIKGSFTCSHCHSLQSLTGIEQLEHCYDFMSTFCPSMTFLTKDKVQSDIQGSFDCSNCVNLKTISGGPAQINGVYNITDCPNITDLLHLFDVTGITRVVASGTIGDIMTRGLQARNEFQTQGELFDAGYDHMAI